MKKAAALIACTLLLVSCNNNVNKKIIESPTPTPTPAIIEDTSLVPTPVDKSTDEKVEDKENEEKSNPAENKDTKDVIIDTSGLSNEKIASWMPGRNKEHKIPQLNKKFSTLLDKYDGYFVGDTSSNIVYLTFDEGYENGYSPKILDILKANNVEAAFFVTKPFIKQNPDLVKRMVNEGHVVANHSDKHPSMPDVSDERVLKELNDTADYFKEITGTDMPKFFRPPMGEWSERTLYLTKSLGYKTILWSMAHKDWETNNQPGKEAAEKFVDTYYHNGAIILLHAVSKSNTEALDDIIKNLQAKGYRFASLRELK